MGILERVMKRAGIRRTQSTFRGVLFSLGLVSLGLAIAGRLHYANLSRFSGKHEKTFRHWFSKRLDFVAVNSCLVEVLQVEGRLSQKSGLAIDASFIPKSGKHPPHLGKYWESKQGKAVKGLEVSCCALIDPNWH